MIVALWILAYLFVGGLLVGWWHRYGVFDDDEDPMMGVAVVLWPVGAGFEVAYQTARLTVWLRKKIGGL